MVRFDRLRPSGPRQQRAWLVIGLVLLVLALAVPLGLKVLQPSGSGDESAPMPASGGLTEPQGSRDLAPLTPDTAGGSSGSGSSSDGAVPGAVASSVGTKLARTAWLGIKVDDVAVAGARVRAIAEAAGGQILSESIVTAPDPTGSLGSVTEGGGMPKEDIVPPVGMNEARITLGVPADRLDQVLADLSSARVGTVSYRSSQAENVTEAYVDTQARIQPAKESIARVRALMVKATTLDQIVLLEGELARRQADLDSLQQRLAELERRTSTSTVSVTLWTDSTASPEPEENGFVQSLRKAWGAFLDSIMVVVTGLAVLLPWLLLALVVAWFVRRWLRHRSRGASSATD